MLTINHHSASPTEVVHATVEIDESNAGIRSRLVLGLDKHSSGDGDEREYEPHEAHTPEEKRTTPDACRQECERKRARKAEHRASCRDESSVGLPCDSGALEHASEIVRDKAVARPLLGNTAPNENECAPTVTRRVDECHPACCLSDFLELDCLADFSELELNNGVLGVTVAVIFS